LLSDIAIILLACLSFSYLLLSPLLDESIIVSPLAVPTMVAGSPAQVIITGGGGGGGSGPVVPLMVVEVAVVVLLPARQNQRYY
jgi:hypothetical protein